MAKKNSIKFPSVHKIKRRCGVLLFRRMIYGLKVFKLLCPKKEKNHESGLCLGKFKNLNICIKCVNFMRKRIFSGPINELSDCRQYAIALKMFSQNNSSYNLQTPVIADY